MTDALRGRHAEAAEAGARYLVRRMRNPRELDRLMADERTYAAYAVAQLEPMLFEESQFWAAEGPTGRALLMHSDAGMGRAIVTIGDPAALDALLSLHPGPASNYLATGAPEHMPVIERHFAVSGAVAMRRMAVDGFAFRRTEGNVRRLMGSDVSALNALYSTEGGPTGYSAAHIQRGVYFGAYDGRWLVAVAGTHVVSPEGGIAVVGNVFTHPAYRGGGLATQVTSAVTEELLTRHGCRSVVLTVNPMNTPAVQAYTRLGFEYDRDVVEARLRRRDLLGVGAWLRRWAARRAAAGGTPGDEVTTGAPIPPVRSGGDNP
ncbi:MAG: GNAT family N-acetyltransferase [Dehalococcoidia bacterium]